MKIKTILFLAILCFVSCKKDKESGESLTEHVIGEYNGQLFIRGNALFYFENYSVLVTRSGFNNISVESLSGTEFTPIEFDLERVNETAITGRQESGESDVIQFENQYSTPDSILTTTVNLSSDISFTGVSVE